MVEVVTPGVVFTDKLLDHKTKKLYFKVATGVKGTDIKQFEIDLGQGIAGYVAQTGEPLLIPDVAKDPRWYKEISESIGFKTQSIACVPMKVNGEIIGVVEIIDKADGSSIRDEDLKILSVFADLAAQAIGNAIDKGIVSCYGAHVVDGPVVKPLRTQEVDVRFSHIAWRAGELNRIVQHGTISCL